MIYFDNMIDMIWQLVKIKYIISLVLVKPRVEFKMIIKTYSLTYWIVFRLRGDYIWHVGGYIKYY